MTRTILIAFFASLIPTAVQGRADDKKSWKGELVVYKVPAEKITFGDNSTGKQVNYKFMGRGSFKLRDDKDGGLRIFDGHKEGWADKDQFILSRDATAYFTDQINADPKDVWSWSMRAWASADRGELDNSIKDYTEAIRLDPNHHWSFNGRGSSWLEKKEYDNAIKDYTEAIHLDPNENTAFNSRAWMLATCPESKWRDGKKAVEDAKKACERDEKRMIYFGTLAAAYAEAGQFDKAVEAQKKALAAILPMRNSTATTPARG